MTSAATITAGTLGPGNVITIEAYGSYVDPVPSAPDATFKLKLGSTTIYTDTETVGGGRWRIRALITVRTAGTSGTVVGTVVIRDDIGFTPFPASSQTATVNTATSLAVDLRAAIADSTGEEAIHCDQLVIHLE